MGLTKYFVLVGFIIVSLGVIYGVPLINKKEVLTLHALSVSKGDAVLIESPSRTRVLIDAGDDRSILRALGEALPPWVRSLDAFIETADTRSAAGGEADVLSNYTVRTVLTQADIRRGTRLDFGGGTYADVLYPDRDTSKMNPKDGAVVLRVVYGTTSFLIKENLSPRADEWLSRIEGQSRPGEIVIASSTPEGIEYVSDGSTVKQK